LCDFESSPEIFEQKPVAKNSSVPRSPSRIRFILFEAELGDSGDISQITHAITNALRSPVASGATKRLVAHASPSNTDQQTDTEVVEAESEEIETVDVTPSTPKAPRPRKTPKAPGVVHIDMNADVSLASFAAGKDANTQHKKFLICAAWLKEHRSIDAVTASHIYTCFRSMRWSSNIPDFSQPLRALKADNYFSKGGGLGEYEINHLGLDFVKNLGSDGTS
jgi:hypothetical protein